MHEHTYVHTHIYLYVHTYVRKNSMHGCMAMTSMPLFTCTYVSCVLALPQYNSQIIGLVGTTYVYVHMYIVVYILEKRSVQYKYTCTNTHERTYVGAGMHSD